MLLVCGVLFQKQCNVIASVLELLALLLALFSVYQVEIKGFGPISHYESN